jgi:hypothetical protein
LVYVTGDVQGVQSPESRRHSNVAPSSSAVNSNVAVVWFVGFAGFDVIVVFGPVVSTTTVLAADATEVLPAASVAVAVYEWVPSATDATAFVHAPPASAAVVPFELPS